MKRLILLILTIFSAYNAGAHNPFRPISEFQQDTLAYLKYNYGSENYDVFKGKTINDFLNNSDVVYTTFRLVYDKAFGEDRKIIGIKIYLQPYEYIVKYRKDIWVYGVHFELSNALTKADVPEIYNEFYCEFLKCFPLNTRNLEFIKNFIVKTAYYTSFTFV